MKIENLKLRFFLKLWIILSSIMLVKTVVVLRNNGYEGLIIAIHPNTPENPQLVENIKALMTSASAILYQATNQRAFFRDITISVPPNWSPVAGSIRGGHRFNAAEIRIDRPNPEYGNNPYTLQPGGCGEAGLYIHLTPEFILDLHGTITEEYGDPGKTLVHEWAHLRYGVFDEYGTWDDFRTPPFYIDDNGKVQVTGCGQDIKGIVETPEGGPCIDPQNCAFKVNFDATAEKSSLMYLHFLPMVDGFCGSQSDRPHNGAAPNKQNLLCQGKSAWDIIVSHEDFADGRNPSNPNADTRPNFRILQPKKAGSGTYILLLDISGSMAGNRIAMLRRSAARFLMEQIPDGSQLGVVAFSTQPVILSNLTQISSDSRRHLVRALPTQDDGGNTGIGAGLISALQLLNATDADADGGTIILISDGEENVPPYVQKIIPELVSSRVITNTVAFGKMASSQLENLVKMTGGRGFFYSDEDVEFPRHDNVLESAFFASTSTQADIDIRPVEILNKLEIVDPRKIAIGSVYVEEDLRKNLRFTFGYAMERQLRVEIVNPQGKVIGTNSEYFKHDSISKTVAFQIPMAMSGDWKYKIASGTKQGIGVTVLAEPTDIKQQPIRIRAWMNEVQIHFPQDAARTKVFAEVSKNYNPVLDALVLAVIERPIGAPVELLLRDDGIGPDVTTDDGIYSAYFTQFNGTGRYSVTARVINDGRAHMKLQNADELFPGTSAVLSKKQFLQMQQHSSKQRFHGGARLGNFQRTTNAGSFRLTGWSEDDVIPPGRVTNLQLSEKSGILKLAWTSPGDDLFHGNATNLEVRFYGHVPPFAAHFDSGMPINESHLVTGTLQPFPGGTIQDINIRLAEVPAGRMVYIALRAYDESGNIGEVSNMASVKINLFSAKTTAPSIFAVVAYPILALTTIVFTIITAVLYRQRWTSAARSSYSLKWNIQVNFKTTKDDSNL